MSIKGDLSSISKFSASLRRLPLVVAAKAALEAAPILTSMVEETFNASEDSYGNLWDPGKDGSKITLRETGALAQGLKYVAVGTKLRLRLAVAHAKYQIGRRPVAPSQGGELPVAYSRALARVISEVCKRELEA